MLTSGELILQAQRIAGVKRHKLGELEGEGKEPCS